MVLKKLFKTVVFSVTKELAPVPVQDKIAIVIFSVSLLPFFILSFYNTPRLDDYTFSLWSNQMSFIQYMKFVLVHENGRFTALALLYFIPDAAVSTTAYKIYPIIILLFFIYSLSVFLKTFFKTANSERWMIALGIAACYLNSMPSLYQGIYWMTGSITHILPLVIILWILVGLKKISESNNQILKKSRLFFCLVPLVFFIVAFEEIIMIFIFCLFLFLFLLSAIAELKQKRMYFILFLVSFIGVVLVIISPGTLLRATSKHSDKVLNLAYTTYGSLYWGSIFIFKTVILNPLMVFLAYLFFKPTNTINVKFKKLQVVTPFFLLVISYGIILLFFFPGMLSMIGTYPRMRNVILFLSTFILAYNLLNLKIYYNRLNDKKLSKAFQYFPVILSIFIIVTGNQKKVIKDIIKNSPQKQSLEYTIEPGISNRYNNSDMAYYTINSFFIKTKIDLL